MKENVTSKNGKLVFIKFEPYFNEDGILEYTISDTKELEALFNYVVENNIEKWTAIYKDQHFDWDNKYKRSKNVHDNTYNINPFYKKPEVTKEYNVEIKPVDENTAKVAISNNDDNHKDKIVDIVVSKDNFKEEEPEPVQEIKYNDGKNDEIIAALNYGIDKLNELQARFIGEYKKILKEVKSKINK